MPITSVAPAIVPVSPTADVDELRQRLAELQEHALVREPEHDGDVLDKTVTWRDAVDAGLVLYDPRPGIGRPPDVFRPPDPQPPDPQPPGDWDDLTPPPPLDNLIVTSIPTGFFIEFDAPTYSQGGGNAYSIIYRANYSGSGPLPTLASAEECGRCTERSPILIIAAEPGTQSHFWAQPVTHAEDFNGIPPRTPPTGGTNGVSAVAGQLSDDHIANLRAGKILAGSIAVGEYIQSTGFVTGSFGWRILGNGNAEFNNVVARGTIYATAGLIGGASINSSGVQSTNYVANTSGWRLDNATGDVYATGGGRVGGFEIEGTRSVVRAGGFMRVTGEPFGSTSQFIDWYGPDLVDLDDCQESNALMYFKADGSAYFGGSLSAGTLVNSAATSDLSATAEIIVGPFETLGDTKQIVLSYSYRRDYTCDAGTGGISGTGSATVVLERSLNGGAWVQIGTLTVSNSGIYTPAAGPGDPDTVSFNMGGSTTVTDNSAATTNMRLRGRINARTLPTFSGANKQGDSPSQRVSVASTEQ